MSGWVSVEDYLPEGGDWYLVAATTQTPGGGERVATMAFLDYDIDDISGESYIWLAHNDTDSDAWDYVTHWMPLPDPPEDV